MMKSIPTAALLVGIMMLGMACGSHNHKMDPVVGALRAGDYMGAADTTYRLKHKAEPRDKLLMCMEDGAVQRIYPSTRPNNQSFDEAEALFAVQDQKAKLRLDQEGIALLGEQAARDYEGYGYDRVMINVYKALNCLHSGDGSGARAEIRRIAESQKKCEDRYQNKIKQEKEANEKLEKEGKVKVESGRTLASPEFQQATSELTSGFDAAPVEDLRHVTLYANPFAEYLQGLFYLHSPFSGDAEVGRVAIRNTAGMMTNNYLVNDVADAERIASGERVNKTYVILETGMAPRRDQIKIRVPIFIYNVAIKDTKVDYFAVAFPKLVKDDVYVPGITASTLNGNFPTSLLVDMDKVVAREFKNDLPRIMTRAIIASVFKTVASYAVAEGMNQAGKKAGSDSQGEELAKVGVRVAMAVWIELTNNADLRTWRTLPKQIQIASLPTPTNGRLNLAGPGGVVIGTVNVAPGKSHLVWVRTPGPVTAARIRQSTLN